MSPEQNVAHYTCYRASGPISIDGRLDEPSWQAAPVSGAFVDIVTGEPAWFDTRVRLLWDDENLYFGFTAEETDVWGTLTERDAKIYEENDLEIFIAGRDAYYEFEISARNVIYEAFWIWKDVHQAGGPYWGRAEFDPQTQRTMVLSGVGGHVHPRGERWGFLDWDCPGLRHAVHVDGTLNQRDDVDRGWSAEIAIPWKSLGLLADGRSLPPRDGDIWRIDCSRFEKIGRGGEMLDPCVGWTWNVHGHYDSHIPETFPVITFSETPVGGWPTHAISALLTYDAWIRIPEVTLLDSIRADAVFGWRQIRKNRVASIAAIVSLALAIGACTSAFQLIDALLLRPLPVAAPKQLYVLARQGIDPSGAFRISDSNEYPLFRRMREAVKGQAELVAVSYADRTDLTYGSDQEIEKANRQYVSGWMFRTFGLSPALGRLFTESDDLKPRAHPQAVLSFDYWTRRFGREPAVIGRTFRMGDDLYEIVGVAPEPFLGTETGVGVDIFLPTMMQPSVERSDASWFRTMAQLRPGVRPESILERLRGPFQAFQMERAKGLTTQGKQFTDRFLNQTLLLEPAAGGRSEMQKTYRVSLAALAVLVALVLLIACANVANLMTAQAAARTREMALRISIGAGRGRLLQLVLAESAWIAFLGAGIGAVFAWWSTPLVVSMINPPDNPARLDLSADWRVLGFAVALAFGVTLLFGLTPAVRASSVKPASALKGSEDPQSRRRLMQGLIAGQVAFCFLVLFVAGLFVATFDRLSHQATGFSSERLLTLDTRTGRAQPMALWDQVAERLRAVPGVERVAISQWALLDGNGSNGIVLVNGAPTDVLAYFLSVSPGWVETMKIPLIDGRDFRTGDTYPNAAIVNQAFVKQCFNGENPIGKSFEKVIGEGVTARFQVVGVVGDARYRNMREPITPTAYVPFQSTDARGVQQGKDRGTFIVRTSSPNPLALVSRLRQEVSAARSEFRVSNVRTQEELIQKHTVRERLLAVLALFFAAVALLLAGIGLYGVLDYSVLQRRREIGIRMALGAQPADLALRVTVDVFSMVFVGAFVGIGLGIASGRYIEALLYQVKAVDPGMLVLPLLALVAVGLVAALRPMIQAVRINPVAALRGD